MANEALSSNQACNQPVNQRDWLEASGLLHIFRTLGLALQPAKLSLALIAIVLTLLLGGVLDWATLAGNGGVSETAIVEFIRDRDLSQPHQAQSGAHGVFDVWRKHEQRCLLGILDTFVPSVSISTATAVTSPMSAMPRMRPWANVSGAGLGLWWLVRYHYIFALLFITGALIIWSCAGGAICRLAALQFAQDQRLTLRQGYEFARRNLWSGLALAPCIPLALVVLAVFLLVAGGFFLRIPVLGDVLGGLAFVMAPFGGFVIAILLVGLAIGGNMFWPAVAAECQDAYDAFARGFSYAFSKPWKTLLYGVIMMTYASFCWALVHIFTLYALRITRGIVRFGAGWWDRGASDVPINKVDLLWPAPQANAFHQWPEWSQLAWFECFSALLIGLTVLLVIAWMWSFLASFYFSGSTVIYFLLRRDVDHTDIGDVQTDEFELDSPADRPAEVPAVAATSPLAQPAIAAARPSEETAGEASADAHVASESPSDEGDAAESRTEDPDD